jgi:RHS repeat-associated protein
MPSGSGQLGSGSADVPGGQFGFASGYKSTAGPYHYGQRYYDPALMRWTQPDPLDQTGDLREGNRYVYAAGNPVGIVDPTGRRGAYIEAGCGGLNVSYSENSRGLENGGWSFGWDPEKTWQCGSSGGYFSGRKDPGEDASAGASVCAVYCVGYDSSTGFKFGLGPKVGLGLPEINFG